MSEVIVIGGGAAGMMAAYFAKRNGHNVTIIEKNEKLGKKLYITGKGRCNYTNSANFDELTKNIVRNPKFMYSSLSAFSNLDAIDLFEHLGLHGKIERGGRVFPVSDKSSDVIKALKNALEKSGVKVILNTTAKNLVVKPIEDNVENDKTSKKNKQESEIVAVEISDERTLKCDTCIVCTGGMSYPSTGSTGDGYKFARNVGHTVTDIKAALSALNVKEDYAKRMQGLSLKNVKISLYREGNEKKPVFSDFGEMLFTHFGVSGPLILTASSYITDIIDNEPIIMEIDFKPALDEEMLDRRILREIEETPRKSFLKFLRRLLPEKATDVFVERSCIDSSLQVGQLTHEQRKELIQLLKCFRLTITSMRPTSEAIITRGGVNVKEINPKNMESKKVKGLRFAGEIIDTDALTGGYNLQIAWSTAYSSSTDI